MYLTEEESWMLVTIIVFLLSCMSMFISSVGSQKLVSLIFTFFRLDKN